MNLKGGGMMKISKQPYVRLQLFIGYHQISMAQVKDSKGIYKGNKKIGIFCVLAGAVIIINVIIKVMI
jgi:hypothetical protein